MNNLVVKPFGEVLPEWKWRTRSEGEISPTNMESRHLFYTFRMIWSHAMPRSAQVGTNINRYAFTSRHSGEYIQQAIQQIGAELFSRSDLLPWQKKQLDQMSAWFKEHAAITVANILIEST